MGGQNSTKKEGHVAFENEKDAEKHSGNQGPENYEIAAKYFKESE